MTRIRDWLFETGRAILNPRDSFDGGPSIGNGNGEVVGYGVRPFTENNPIYLPGLDRWAYVPRRTRGRLLPLLAAPRTEPQRPNRATAPPRLIRPDDPAVLEGLYEDRQDAWLLDIIGFCYRAQVVRDLGHSERDAACYLGSPYGSQGDIARVLDVNQATVSRGHKRVRESLLAAFGREFEVAPKEGRRALHRPRLMAAA